MINDIAMWGLAALLIFGLLLYFCEDGFWSAPTPPRRRRRRVSSPATAAQKIDDITEEARDEMFRITKQRKMESIPKPPLAIDDLKP